jgi:hypothetical protein
MKGLVSTIYVRPQTEFTIDEHKAIIWKLDEREERPSLQGGGLEHNTPPS